MTGTAIEQHTTRNVTPTVPAGEWALMDQQSKALASSDIIPSAYRQKPANVLVAALTGRQHGWDVLTAMRNGHVIEGQWGMKPEAMLGLVRAQGHSVTADIGSDGATVKGKRGDNGDEMTFTFTIDDAVTARLCTLKDGKPYARSKTGKVLPWEQYPQMMCYWRAVGMLCRMLFSDVTLGAYSVEELGAQIDGDGNVVDVGEVAHEPEPQEATPLTDEMWAKIKAEAEDKEVDLEVVLDTAFPDGRPDPMTDRDLPHFRDVFKRIVAARFAAKQAEQEAQQTAEAPDEDGPRWVSKETGEAGAPPDDGSARKATKKQVGLVKSHYDRIGLGSDRNGQLDATAGIINRTIKSHNDLTHAEASTLIDHLSSLPTHDGVSEPSTEPPAEDDPDGDIVDAEIVEDGDDG